MLSKLDQEKDETVITISGTIISDQIPTGGDSVDLMESILRAREAADRCYSLAEQAKHGRHPFLAEFWNEIADLHIEVLRLTATAVERLKGESHAGQGDDDGSVTDQVKGIRRGELEDGD